MSRARIAVLGTGAVGGSVAADLTRAGLDMTLIDQWPAHVEAMRADGLCVRSPDGTTTAPVRALHLCEVATIREPFDVVLVGVKAYDTRWACELIKPVLRGDGIAVGIQNGMTAYAMTEILGPERTLGAVVEIAANMFEPGIIERQTTTAGTWFAVGPCSPKAVGREAELAAILGHAGTVEVTGDIWSSKWMKLVANAAEFLASSILDLPLAEALRVPGMRAVMDAAGSEAVRAGLALDHRIVPMFGKPGIEKNPPDRYAAALLDAVVSHWTLPTTLVATLQDWRKGRRSECDEINGVVVAEQRRMGGSAPVNELLLEIAHRIERGELVPDPGNAHLVVGHPAVVQEAERRADA